MTITQVLLSLLGGGTLATIIAAYFTYRGARPKNNAEAHKIEVDTTVTLADRYERYTTELELRMEKMEKKYEKRIRDLEELIKAKDLSHLEVVKEKDNRIDGLEQRIDYLEQELKKYQGTEHNIEVAKEGLHKDVDNKLNKLKN
jgi:predicted component of viral defense system (DUF524 family)